MVSSGRLRIRKIQKVINNYTYLHWGIVLLQGRFSPKRYKELKSDLAELERQAANSSVSFPVSTIYPCYQDKEDNAGSLTLHYFYQDLHVAQRICRNTPVKHVDIGSRVDGFVAHVASYREIEVLDIRPLDIHLPNIKFKQADLMNGDSLEKECTDSVSCLHALEHFGLGRYGDPLCFEGFLTGLRNITKMLKPTGKFYFSVPIGEQRIEFHAHRVFSVRYLIEILSPDYRIDSFSYVDDANNFYPDVQLTDDGINKNYDCHYGCGIFELTKNE